MSDDATRNANVNLNADVSNYRQGVGGAVQDTNSLAAAVDSLASKLDGLQRRTSKRLTLFGAADLAMVGSMVAVSASYEKSMDRLAAQSAITGRAMGQMSGAVRQTARDWGVARGEIIETATAISKMGVTAARDIAGFTEVFTKAGAAAGESAISIASSMTTLSRQMGTLAGGTKQMQNFTDSLLKVSATAGVSASAVAEFSNSIAPIGRVAGLSQAQVLGLSAAFVQAGNDGFVAANTFNSMLADIVRTTQTGGPGLAKYASLLGKTIDQFKQMPAADQLTGIFKAINDAGPRSVQILDQMGIDGIRAAKAIQVMAAQSGGLEKLVQTATGAYGDDSTNKGAAAALGGMSDQLKRFGNIAQDMATSIGSGIVVPLTAGLNVLNNILAQASKATNLFSAGGSLAALGGAGAMGLGAAGTVASYAALPVALRWMWNSKPMGALREGIGTSRGLSRGTMSMSQALALPYMTRYQSGDAGRLERGMLSAGGDLGAHLPTGGQVAGGLGRVAGLPFRAGSVFATSYRQFYDEAKMPGYARQDGATNLLGLQKGAMMGAVKSTEAFTTSVAKAAVATTRFTTAQARAGLSAAGSVVRPALGALAGGAMNFLGGPLGIGLMAGTAALSLKSMAEDSQNELKGRDGGFYNQLTPYNSALGIATQNLADLSTSLSGTSQEVKTLGDAVTQAKSDMGNGTTNPNTGGIETAEQGAAYLRSLNTQDPKVLKKAMQDVRRALPFDEGNKAIDLYTASNKTLSLSDVGKAMGNVDQAGASDVKSFFGITGSEGADQRTQLGIGAAKQYVTNASMFGSKSESQAQVATLQKLLDQVFTSPDDRSPTAVANRVAAIKQIETQYGMNFNYTASSMGQAKGEYRSGAEFLAAQGPESDYGKYQRSLSGQGIVFGAGAEANVAKLATTEEDPTVAGLKRLGFDINANNGLLSQAATTKTGDPETQAKAALLLYQTALNNAKPTAAQAKRGVTSADLAGANLQGIFAQEGTSTPDAKFGMLYNRAKEAQSLVDVDRQFQGVYQTRAQRLSSSQARYQSVMTEPTTTESTQRKIAAKQEYETQKASYAQYLAQMIQTQENFALQMKRSDQDYYKQRMYSQQDYQRQAGYAAADFAKSIKRSQEDFRVSLTRSAEDSAKSIYNPMQRVQSQYTTDVGTLKQNMADQTRRIRQQVASLRKLRRLGLSQQTIDMLDLANPANAQQVEELTQEMTKGDARTLNSQAGARQSATSSLTQSDLSQSYRRANEDFRKQMTRSSQDYRTSVSRGLSEYQIGMARMADARKVQNARAKEDLDRLSKEYIGDFATMFSKAQTLVKANLGKTGQITMDELNVIKATFPEFFSNMGTTGGAPTAAGEHSGSRTTRPTAVPKPATTTKSTTTVTSKSTYTNLTTFTGPILVTTPDPDKLARAIADGQRADRLKRATN